MYQPRFIALRQYTAAMDTITQKLQTSCVVDKAAPTPVGSPVEGSSRVKFQLPGHPACVICRDAVENIQCAEIPLCVECIRVITEHCQ